MGRRASLTLMELLVMVLVFALAAAVCLRCFAAAAVTARETDLQTRVVLLAQNGAEILKASAGDLETAAEELGAEASGDTLCLRQRELKLILTKENSGRAGLGLGRVQVEAEGKPLVSFPVCWQEVS